MIPFTNVTNHIKRNIGKYAVGGAVAGALGVKGIDVLDKWHGLSAEEHKENILDNAKKLPQISSNIQANLDRANQYNAVAQNSNFLSSGYLSAMADKHKETANERLKQYSDQVKDNQNELQRHTDKQKFYNSINLLNRNKTQ